MHYTLASTQIPNLADLTMQTWEVVCALRRFHIAESLSSLQEVAQGECQVGIAVEEVDLQQIVRRHHAPHQVVVGVQHGGQGLVCVVLQHPRLAARPEDRHGRDIVNLLPALRPLKAGPGGQHHLGTWELHVEVQEHLREGRVADVVNVRRKLAEVKALYSFIALIEGYIRPELVHEWDNKVGKLALVSMLIG